MKNILVVPEKSAVRLAAAAVVSVVVAATVGGEDQEAAALAEVWQLVPEGA